VDLKRRNRNIWNNRKPVFKKNGINIPNFISIGNCKYYSQVVTIPALDLNFIFKNIGKLYSYTDMRK